MALKSTVGVYTLLSVIGHTILLLSVLFVMAVTARLLCDSLRKPKEAIRGGFQVKRQRGPAECIVGLQNVSCNAVVSLLS